MSGSPITTAGIIALQLSTQPANQLFAGPSSGSAAPPSFRSLVGADLPPGTGTVTSVGLTNSDALYVIGGSPVTGSGSISLALNTQPANRIFAGPASGTPSQPLFRSLVGADLPSLTIPGVTAGGIIYGSAAGMVAQNSNFTFSGGGGISLNNIFIGGGGAHNTSGASNLALGPSALNANTTGSNNIAIGQNALLSNTTGGTNIAIGFDALYFNTSGFQNVAIGHQSMFYAQSAAANVGIGYYALKGVTTGHDNMAIGSQALQFLTTASYNTAIGSQALGSITTGDATTGNSNTAVGFNAMYNANSAFENTAVGTHAMFSATTGFSNTALGAEALFFNTTGSSNTAVGLGALAQTNTGGNNAALGHEAGHDVTSGNYNIALGDNALKSTATGNYNIAVGPYSGYTANPANANVSGSNNIWIGYQAGPGTAMQLADSVAIGNNALVSTSNTMVLGGTGADALTVVIGFPAKNDFGKLQLIDSVTMTQNLTDGFVAALTLNPTYDNSFVVARHNYINVANVLLTGLASVTDAAVLRFDAEPGTHLAVDAATIKVRQW